LKSGGEKPVIPLLIFGILFLPMSFFSSQKASVRFGAVVEIGSGSVLVSIVRSDQNLAHPDIIWSKRECAPRRTTDDLLGSAKSVLTALMNAFLLIDSEGRKVLRTSYPGVSLINIQVSITAPWSYTITKVINYTQPEHFTITGGLIQSLMEAAQKKITEELKENELASDLGLTIMARATTDIEANDYKTLNPIGQISDSLTLTQVSAVAQAYLTDAILDLQLKVLPRAKLERYSFMLMFHCIIRDLHHQITEYCLIDITDEATEIGIVRGGILRYCTHTAFGISTIARDIAAALDLPYDEAQALLKEPYFSHARETMSDVKKSTLEKILVTYQEHVTGVFRETGDALSIPKTLFLHGNHQSEEFFISQIVAAAHAATASTHTVHLVSTELLTQSYTPEQKAALLTKTPDTAMLVAAQFFHKQHHCNDFIQV
jgi:hypothetical protein